MREPPGGTVPGDIERLAAMTGHLRLASQPTRTVPPKKAVPDRPPTDAYARKVHLRVGSLACQPPSPAGRDGHPRRL